MTLRRSKRKFDSSSERLNTENAMQPEQYVSRDIIVHTPLGVRRIDADARDLQNFSLLSSIPTFHTSPYETQILGGEIHFNPSPIFIDVPPPSTLGLLTVAAVSLGMRRFRR